MPEFAQNPVTGGDGAAPFRPPRVSVLGVGVSAIGMDEAVHTIGLIVPVREPATAMAAALLTEARRLSEALDTAG